MVLPILGAIGGIASAGLGIADLIMRGNQEKMQRALMERQLDLAYKQYLQSIASRTNERGDQVVYDPATNTWRTILTSTGRALQSAADTEELKRNTTDAAARREALLDTSRRRVGYGQNADVLEKVLMDRVLGTTGPTEGQIASDKRLSRTAAVNRGFDDVQSAAALQGIRSSNPHLADTLSNLARERTAAVGEAQGDATTEGRYAARELQDSDTNRLGGTFNQFATRAAGVPDAPFYPFSTTATDMSRLAQAMAPQALGSALKGTGDVFSSSMLYGKTPGYYSTLGIGANSLLRGTGALWESLFDQPDKKRTGGNTQTGDNWNAGWNYLFS